MLGQGLKIAEGTGVESLIVIGFFKTLINYLPCNLEPRDNLVAAIVERNKQTPLPISNTILSCEKIIVKQINGQILNQQLKAGGGGKGEGGAFNG